MKLTRKLCAAFLLSSVCSLTTIAGVISTPVAPPPPPITVVSSGDISTGATGQTDTTNVAGEISTTAQASDSIIETVMSLVQSVLALF